MTNNSIIVRGKNDGIIIKHISAGTNIKHLRQHLSKTQENLAKETFINVSRMRKIENCGLSPTIDEMIRICNVLQV